MTLIKLEPTYKKSTVEIEYFSDGKGTWVQYETGWRWGVFYADVTDEEMEELKAHNKDCEDNNSWEGFEVSALSGFEMDHTWDGCWTDVSVYKNGQSQDDIKEQIEESDDWWDYIVETLEMDSQDCETYIQGIIDIELIDKLPWDNS